MSISPLLEGPDGIFASLPGELLKVGVAQLHNSVVGVQDRAYLALRGTPLAPPAYIVPAPIIDFRPCGRLADCI